MQERKRRPPYRKAEPLPEPIPARSEEELEKRCCGYAYDLAAKWLKEGTAPAQVVVHFLKIASMKEQAELEKTRKEIEVLEAKKKYMESSEKQEEKYQEVIQAISSYMGKDNEWEIIEDEYPEYLD